MTYIHSLALNVTIIDRLTGENSSKQVDLTLYDSELQAFANQTFFETKLTNNITVICLYFLIIRFFCAPIFNCNFFYQIELKFRNGKPYSNKTFIFDLTQHISYNESISKFSRLKSDIHGKVNLSFLVGLNIAWINLKVFKVYFSKIFFKSF